MKRRERFERAKQSVKSLIKTKPASDEVPAAKEEKKEAAAAKEEKKDKKAKEKKKDLHLN